MTKQIVITSIILLCSIILFEFSNIDLWLQDTFYNFELKQWVLDRDYRITKFIFYDGIKKVLVLFILVMLSGLLFFRKSQLIQANKQGLVIVCLSALMVPLVIGALQVITNTPCPRDITHYGGRYPYVTVLEKYPQSFKQTEKMKCYPAGHASGGFALLALFFLFKNRKKRIIALSFAMVVGWSMGAYKMLIGDHFLSHTIVTMLLAWLIILIIAKSVRRYFNSKNIPHV